MSRVFVSIKQLVCSCFHILQDGFLRWARPLNTSLLLGTLADLARGKSELVAENALLRQQLIILRRQSKRPVCTKRDRILLVLLAKAVRAWRQALLIVQPETLLMWHRQGCAPLLEAEVKDNVNASEGESLDHRVDQGDGQEQPTLGSGTDPWRITQAGYSRVPAARSKSTCDVCARLNHAGEIWACDFLQVTDLLFRSLFAFFDTLAANAHSDPCRCDALSYRRMDRTPAAGGHSVWTHAEISHSRS